jgi:thiol-disulfide isomerase/thioredoxin
MLRRLLLVGVVALGLGVLAADEWESERTPLGSFSVKDLDGRVLTAADLEGKVVVVDFWAIWCAPCVKELPELAEYYEKTKARRDVLFLSFDVGDDPGELREFVKKKGVPYPVYLADSLADKQGVFGFPTKFVIDARGKRPVVRFRRVGYAPVAEIEAKVRKLLSEPSAP